MQQLSDDANGVAVRLQGITKDFGKLRAVSELDLEVPRGSLYGLLGPNGSGKTTTIRMIMGILRPDRGTVSLLGSDPAKTGRNRIGYLPEERGLYKAMKVLEQLVFLGQIRGMERKEAQSEAARWLERLDLADRADRKVEDLSKGMQQKVQFIGTVLHRPDLLVLDEPFSGLDPINQDLLEAIVREFHEAGVTILFSTHLMDQAERLCERVCLISQSRRILDGDLRELKRQEGGGVVAIDFEGDDGWVRGREVLNVERTHTGVRVQIEDGADPHSLLERAVASGVRVRRFQLMEPRLHEIFVRHVTASRGAPGDRPQFARETARPGAGV
jgi:ABC-2 type transport system ATP-binding protein